jgi:phosphate transport system protein
MRDAYHEELERLNDQLVEMTRLVGSAISRASTALLDADLSLAESVIVADNVVDRLRDDLDRQAMDLLARQQPVASDLRVIVTALKMSADLERMGDLARHVAKVARLRYPDSAVPADVRATILQMGQVAERIVAKCGQVIAAKDVEDAKTLERDDDAMDELHRTLFGHLIDGSWKHGTEAAVDMTLVGRYYERFADHAVSVAHRVVYLVTGEWDVAEDHEEQEDRASELR